MRFNADKRHRGLALMLVLIVVAILTVLGSVLLATAATSGPMFRLSADRLRARMIAEAAIAMAIEHVQTDADWRTRLPNGRWIESQPMEGGSFTLYGEDGTASDTYGPIIGDGSLSDDRTHPFTLTVIGIYGSARHVLRATLSPTADSAVAVSQRLEVRHAGLIDSYDSAAGPYSAATARTEAILSSNDTSKPSITLRDAARVHGNVLVGPGGTPGSAVVRLDSSAVTGVISGMPAEIPISRPIEPTGMPASLGSGTFSEGTRNISGNVRYDNLTLNGTAILNVQGSASLLVDGKLLIGDGASIQFIGGSTYAAIVSGSIEFLNHTFVDSYDSSSGPYGGANIAPTAMATLLTAPAAIKQDGGTVTSDLFVGPGGNPDTAIAMIKGTHTGQRAALTQTAVIPPPPAWPTNVGTNLGDYHRDSGTHTIDFNMHVDSFRITKGAIVRISGHQTIRVNRDLLLDGFAKMEILPASSLRIYVGERCIFGNKTEANATTNDPSRLIIYGMGNGHDITLTNETEVHAVIDAPNYGMTAENHARFFGVFMGSRLVLKNLSEFHHDRNAAIAAVNPRLPINRDGRLAVFARGGVTIESSARINDGGGPSAVTFHQLTDQPIDLAGESVVVAGFIAPDSTFTARGRTRFTGTVRALEVALRDNAVIATDGSGGAANPGILADYSIEMSGLATLSPTSGAAVLAVNRAGTAVVHLRDSARVEGSALGGPGGDKDRDIRVASGSLLRGTRGSLPAAVPIVLPAAPAMAGSPQDLICAGVTKTTLSSDRAVNNLDVRDDATLEISGRVSLVINGSMRFRDRGVLTLLPGARLTIWLGGPAEFSGSARLNPDGRPSSVVLNNTGVAPIELRDQARLWGTINSPSAPAKVGGAAHLFGSFKGQRLTVESQGQVHYDVNRSLGVGWVE